MNLSDTEFHTRAAKLTALAKNGDNESLQELLKMLEKTIYTAINSKLIKSQDFRDVVQEVHLQIIRKIHTVRDNRSIAGWVKTLSCNITLNYNKDKGRSKLYSLRREEMEITQTPSGIVKRKSYEKMFDNSEAVHQTLNSMKSSDRDILQKVYIDGIRQLDLSNDEKIPFGTIKRRTHVARNRFKKIYMELTHCDCRGG
jgi:RNA polymerase sigma-70 factor (ECF subfamily)